MKRFGRHCRRVLPALAAVICVLWAANVSAADPPPKDKPDDGLIWLYDHRTDRLVAYTPDGKKDREIDPRVSLSSRFIGLTADGSQVLYAARAGAFPKDDVDEIGRAHV